MAIITGTGTFTNGNTSVSSITGLSLAIQGNVTADAWIKRDGEPTVYHVAVPPSSETSITMLEEYQGTTGTDTFQIFTDFLTYEIVLLKTGMKDSYHAINENIRKLINKLIAAGAPEDEKRIITRVWIGQPVQNKEFGYVKLPSDCEIDTIGMTCYQAPDNDVVLDYSVNDTYQSMNLTQTSGSNSVESADLSYLASATNYLKFKFTSVGSFPGADYHIDIKLHNNTAMQIRYDFQRVWIGELQAGKEFGIGFNFPVKSKVFGISYNLDIPHEGDDLILKLYKDNVDTGSSVTITDGTSSGYSALAQVEYTTSEECTIYISQVGSSFAGQNLHVVLHSYRVE